MAEPSRRVQDVPDIATYDRRLRVFVSSTLHELAAERVAVRAAVEQLRLTPVMFELGARPHPPQELYRAYLAQSDVFVGIYGDSYGWVAPSADVSGLADELRLSGDLPRLLYVRTPAPDRDPRLTELLQAVWQDGRTSTKPYGTPAELGALVADDLAVLLTERFTAHAAVPGLRPGSVPVPPTPLVDRTEALAQVLDLLRRSDVRLVTITGPGGIGKTRLALEAARTLEAEHDAVWFVDLSSVEHAALVAPTIASALGVRVEGSEAVLDVLGDRLAGARALLVLDNVEQVSDAAPDLAGLLAAAPGLRLLVTSRVLLRLRGEHDVALPPLATPEDDDVAGVAASAAATMVVDRARQARPSFALTTENAPAVAGITRLTEGVPLAIEIVAARLRLLSPQALQARLGDRLDLRTTDVDRPARQQTLRATVDWSVRLLGADERRLLARLSVCSGGWTLETAEALGGDLDGLSGLVAASLVAPDDTLDEPRFTMLEVVREVAAELLVELGEVRAARDRLGDHLEAWSTVAGAGLAGPDSRRWRARVDAEVDDLRAVLHWAVEDDRAERVVRIAAALTRYWWLRGMLVEMLEIAEQTARLPSAARLPDDATALLLWSRGTMRIALGRSDEAPPLLEQSLEPARRLDDDALLGHALTALAMTRAPSPEVRALLEEAVERLRRSGDRWSTAYALVPLGHVLLLLGDVGGAAERHAEALGLATAIDDDHLRAQAHDQLAGDLLMTGDTGAARAHLGQAVVLHRATRDQEGLSYCLDGMAALALATGDAPLAGRLLGAADRAREVVGASPWPFVRPLLAQLSDAADALLGPDVSAAERAAGARLSALAALQEGAVRLSLPVDA